MCRERSNRITLMNIENKVLSEIELTDLIDKFARDASACIYV